MMNGHPEKYNRTDHFIIEFNIYLFFLFHRATLNGISIPNEDEVDYSNDNHVHDDDDLSNDDQEKQFEDELDDIDTNQQIQNNMAISPGATEMTPQIATPSRRFRFLSKIPSVYFLEIYNSHLIVV